MFFLTFRYYTFKISAKFSVVLPIIKMSTNHSHEEFQKFQNVLWPKSSRYHLSRPKKNRWSKITIDSIVKLQVTDIKGRFIHKAPSSLICFDLPNGYTKDRIFSIRNFQHTFTQIHSTTNDFLAQLIWKIQMILLYTFDSYLCSELIIE